MRPPTPQRDVADNLDGFDWLLLVKSNPFK